MSIDVFTPGAGKPTVVLVHGAFAESSSWNDVVRRLQREDLPVAAIANPLRGLEPDAEYLRSVIDHIDGPVVVAGHSYGGSVASEATEGADNVRALVFVASFLLEPGESTGELAASSPEASSVPRSCRSCCRPRPTAARTSTSTRASSVRFFAADVPEETAAPWPPRSARSPPRPSRDKASRAGWKTIPSWTLVTLEDLAVPPNRSGSWPPARSHRRSKSARRTPSRCPSPTPSPT